MEVEIAGNRWVFLRIVRGDCGTQLGVSFGIITGDLAQGYTIKNKSLLAKVPRMNQKYYKYKPKLKSNSLLAKFLQNIHVVQESWKAMQSFQDSCKAMHSVQDSCKNLANNAFRHSVLQDSCKYYIFAYEKKIREALKNIDNVP